MFKFIFFFLAIAFLSTAGVALENDKFQTSYEEQFVNENITSLSCPILQCEIKQNNDMEFEEARSGCCSHHNGVCGCTDGRAQCCDGSLSPSCGC